MSDKTNSKDPDIAEGTKRAADKVPDAVDRAGDNTPTKPGTEAKNAAAGTNETRPDSAQLPENDKRE